MKMNAIKLVSAVLFLTTLFGTTSCGQGSNPAGKSENIKALSTDNQPSEVKYKVTFIELGSVRCIPCQQMQSVMKSIERKYCKEVKVVFHDVWTEDGKPFGTKYGIESIPTQIFLDDTGKEFYRHIGYLPEEELIKVLQMKGVKSDEYSF
jgi:thioredoxin 1